MRSQPIEEHDGADQPQGNRPVRDVSECRLAQPLPLAQQAQHQDTKKDNRSEEEFRDRPNECAECWFHVCPFGKKDKSYREAFLAVISHPSFVFPLAFCAGMFSTVLLLQSVLSAG
jgi:hypothetical protein